MNKFDVVVKDDLYIANKGDTFPDKEANVIEEKVYVLVVDSYKKIYLNLNYGTYDFVNLFNFTPKSEPAHIILTLLCSSQKYFNSLINSSLS